MIRLLWGTIKLGLMLGALAGVAGLAAYLTIQFVTTTKSVEVPDLVGMTPTQATRALNDLDLRLQFEEDERNLFDERVAPGHIARQEPAAGNKLKQGRKVKVVLSLGARHLFVPRVVG